MSEKSLIELLEFYKIIRDDLSEIDSIISKKYNF